MFKKLSISSWKFFLAGDGMSVRTGKYFFESALVGLMTGLVVVAFRYLIDFVHGCVLEGLFHHRSLSRLTDGSVFGGMFSADALLSPRRWMLVLLPAIGALLGHFLISKFSKLEMARGTDSAIKAYHQHDGYITGTVIPVKSVASVLTVGFGGSAGYEGPVTLIGAACGSFFARYMKLTVRARRILMAAGLSAGISALFQAPLAGAIFGFEIFYSSSDIEYETVLPSFIASAVSYSVFSAFFGFSPLFKMPSIAYENSLRLFPYIVLAFVIVFGVRFYISAYRFSEKTFSEMKVPNWAKVVVGGLATGCLGFFFPDILGTSYNIIQASFTAGSSDLFARHGSLTIAGFICFFFVKAIATSFTVGSGGSGGVFAPAIVCGGTLGAAVGLFFAKILPPSIGIHPAAFALVGMAGFLASAIRIPLTAIVMVAEISGNHALLLPAMWVCCISFWLNNDWSLYRSQVHSRESSPVHA